MTPARHCTPIAYSADTWLSTRQQTLLNFEIGPWGLATEPLKPRQSQPQTKTKALLERIPIQSKPFQSDRNATLLLSNTIIPPWKLTRPPNPNSRQLPSPPGFKPCTTFPHTHHRPKRGCHKPVQKRFYWNPAFYATWLYHSHASRRVTLRTKISHERLICNQN